MTHDPATDAGRPGYAWYVLAILWLVYTLNFLDRMVVAILIEPIRREFGVSDTALGLLSGMAFASLYAAFAFPIARLADRASRVRLLAAVLVTWTGFTMLSAAAGRFPLLLLARMGVAVGEAGCVPSSHAILADYFPPQRRATALGIHSTAVSAGLLLAFLFGGFVAGRYGWRAAFLAVGAPGPLLALLLLWTVKDPRAPLPTEQYTPRPSFAVVLRGLFAVPSFRHALAGSTLMCFVSYGSLSWTAALIERRFGMSAADTGRGLGLAFGGGTAIGAVVGGLCADALGRHDARWYAWLPALAALAYFPTALAAYNGTTAEASFAWLILPSIMGAIFMGPVYSLTQAFASTRERATAAAILSVAYSVLGNGLGPLAVGVISDAAKPTFGPRSLAVALSAAACVMLWATLHFALAARTLRTDMAAR